MLANLRLVDEIEDCRHTLFPCWVVMPSLSGEFPSPEELMRLMERHNVRAVRLQPWRFSIPIRERLWAGLRDRLLERETLCVIPSPSYGGSLEPVEELLRIFSECKCVLVDCVWSQWREVVWLMDEFENLHLEFSLFQANRAVEYFAERYGPERCLFSSGLLERAPTAGRGFLDYSLLSKEDVRLIAGENLGRLLGQRPGADPEPGEWHDALTEACRAGKPVPCLVLDAQCHISHPGGATLGKQVIALDGDADGMIELTRRAGTDRTAIMSWVGPLAMDSEMGNRVVEEAVRRYPDEFIGLVTINPEYDEHRVEETIRRYHLDLGFPGLKTYTPCRTIDYDDPAFEKWFRFGNEHNLYLVLDPRGGSGAQESVRRVAGRYPQLGIHLDHSGRSWEYAKWVVSLAKEYIRIFTLSLPLPRDERSNRTSCEADGSG